MKVRAQFVKVRPVWWSPFPVEHITDRYQQPAAAPIVATCSVCHALRAQHPMERLMSIESDEQGTAIATTGVHLARNIGNAIHHAYRGKLTIDYDHAETELHVIWHRD